MSITTENDERKPSSRIVLVDDDAEIGRAVSRLLRQEGCHVDYFEDCQAALDAVRTGMYSMILSDIAMPGMDGIELMRQVRRFDFDIPIILLTGEPTIDSAKKAIELGAYRYFTKPLDRLELVAAVKSASFAIQMAKIKRKAAELNGLANGPSDMLGLLVAYEAAAATLWMAYQPIVRAKDGSIFAYEALMRSESKTLPHPGAILSAAEHLDKLDDLGRRIRDLSPRPFDGAGTDALLFLNLHPSDLADPQLLEASSYLAGFAKRTVLEITERATLENVPDVQKTITTLRSRGFRVAVDDLGSGYAGLNSFAQIEPEIVKLDMAIVRDVDTNVTKQKLMHSMVDLSHDMNILVVAEGVETRTERDKCVELGCDLLQGYHIARPGVAFPAVSW
ncbi:EAL domain-containing protein [Myxococcota bacterium]|nr:EAL domain-containing protein [Myxococcota bacterium]